MDTVVLTDIRLDPDAFMLDGVDTSKEPHFTVSEIGKIFFARTSHWVRWLEAKDALVIDGDPTCRHSEPTTKFIPSTRKVKGPDGKEVEEEYQKEVPSKIPWIEDGICTKCGGVELGLRRTEKGARTYTLSDVERIVHALASQGRISGAQAANALHIVQTIAKVWGYLP